MIELFTWPTPNGRKASIALEEFELDYQVQAIDITTVSYTHLTLPTNREV